MVWLDGECIYFDLLLNNSFESRTIHLDASYSDNSYLGTSIKKTQEKERNVLHWLAWQETLIPFNQLVYNPTSNCDRWFPDHRLISTGTESHLHSCLQHIFKIGFCFFRRMLWSLSFFYFSYCTSLTPHYLFYFIVIILFNGVFYLCFQCRASHQGSLASNLSFIFFHLLKS